MATFEEPLKHALTAKLVSIEQELESDVITIFGPINDYLSYVFPGFLESLKNKKDSLSVILETRGGSAEVVERLVNVIRHFYKKVSFIIPNQAMSAGTIFAMSGDTIMLTYSSVLGPIDPQVWNGKAWVPALGYLNKLEELIDKDRNGNLTNAEFALLNKMDLAELSLYQQQKELTITLLKNWLVKFKFKDWSTHQTDTQKKGKPVTLAEKEARAKEIAEELGNNQKWHSHSRGLNIETLNSIRLKVDNYGENQTLKEHIRDYFELFVEYAIRKEINNLLHHRDDFV